MPDQVLFDFAVPDELLQEAVAKSRDPEVIADLAVMPGTGEGKPPALVGILRQNGFAPLILLTLAALVPGSFGNGIALIGTNLEHSFHIHDAALGAVTFVAAVAQLLWAVPLALRATAATTLRLPRSAQRARGTAHSSWATAATKTSAPSAASWMW